MRKILITITVSLFSLSIILSYPGVASASAGGYVDAQITTGADSLNSPTFQIAEGALYLSHESGKTKGMVDIPFTFAGTGTTNDFTLATVRGQAYVSHAYDFGLSWQLGQWDTPYGLDPQDSVNYFFTDRSQFNANNLPNTHTGMLLGYGSGGIEIKALIANHFNEGRRNAKNFDYGAVVKFTHDMFWIQGGYLHFKDRATSTSSMLADFTFGTKQGDITADGEFALSKPTGSGVDTGVAVTVQGIYQLNKTYSAGVRAELMSKVVLAAGTTTHSQFELTPGFQAKLTDQLHGKLDYSFRSTTLVSGGTATKTHVGTLGALYKF